MMTSKTLAAFLVSSLALSLYSCSSVKDTSNKAEHTNEFFDPATTVVTKKVIKPAEQVTEQSRVGQSAKQDTALKEDVLAENERLKNLIGEMKSSDERLWKSTDALSDLERSAEAMTQKRALASNLELIELLKEQNARLIDVLEQLKTIVSQQNLASQSEKRESQMASTADGPTSVKTVDVNLAYGRAIRAYQEHRYEQALFQFWQIITSKKAKGLADNCRFWMGVSLFNLQKYSDAIPLFKRLVGVHKFEKRESAYIMLGQCYEQMGEKSLAKSTYEALVRSNPLCEMAQVAQLKISML